MQEIIGVNWWHDSCLPVAIILTIPTFNLYIRPAITQYGQNIWNATLTWRSSIIFCKMCRRRSLCKNTSYVRSKISKTAHHLPWEKSWLTLIISTVLLHMMTKSKSVALMSTEMQKTLLCGQTTLWMQKINKTECSAGDDVKTSTLQRILIFRVRNGNLSTLVSFAENISKTGEKQKLDWSSNDGFLFLFGVEILYISPLSKRKASPMIWSLWCEK